MMQISMEILSQMITRADSGAGNRQRAGPETRDNSRFDKLFQTAMTETTSDTHATTQNKRETPAAKRDPTEDLDETYAAGATGTLSATLSPTAASGSAVSGTLSVIDSTDGLAGFEPAVGFPDSFSDFHDFAYAYTVG